MMDKERMKELVALLNEHNYYYYTLDAPMISDAEYDALYDELVALEKETGVVLEDSPTQRVGGETLAEFEKHTHIIPLWSLDKARDMDEITAWAARAEKQKKAYEARTGETLVPTEYALEYKFDGLTINLTYDGGKLAGAATRGDGVTGEEILEQVKTIKSIPLTIPFTGRMEVQGEGVIHLSQLQKYNETADEPLKNARNAAAGALRNKDPKVTAGRNLDAYFYNVGYIEGRAFDTHMEMIDFLKKNRIKVSPYRKLFSDIGEMEDALGDAGKKRGRLDFLIDGMVIKINDFRTREALGTTQKFPRWAVAYKFDAEETVTTVEDVVWQVGRTGKLTPLALLHPVDIAGATIRRATLNNFGDIQRKKVCIGSQVRIRRSNDVIPEILGTMDEPGAPGLEPVGKPEYCPACGSALEETGANLFCVNSLSCKPQLVSRIAHFVSRDAMNIETLSKKTVAFLYENMDIDDIAGLYDLDYDKLLDMPGFKQKRVDNIKNAIENSKTPALQNFVYALGISNVGRKTAKDLAVNFGTYEAIAKADKEALTDIRDIGETVADSIIHFFADKNMQRVISRLFALGVRPKTYQKADPENLPLFGRTFVLTGTLEGYTRSEATKIINDLGGDVSSSVSKNTDYVLAGEKPGSKLKKAQTLDVPVLNEREFVDMIKQ